MFFTRLTPLFNHQYPTIIVSTNIQLHILIPVRRGTGVDANSSITIARWNHCYVSLRSLRLLRPGGSLGYLSVNLPYSNEATESISMTARCVRFGFTQHTTTYFHDIT